MPSCAPDRLLRTRRERPRRRCADQCYELVPPHGAYPKAKITD